MSMETFSIILDRTQALWFNKESDKMAELLAFFMSLETSFYDDDGLFTMRAIWCIQFIAVRIGTFSLNSRRRFTNF